MRRAALGVAVLSVVLAACGVTDLPKADFTDDGTIRFVHVEGGCWVIQTDTATFEPLELAEDLQVEDLFVSFSANERPDLASVCQLGPVVEIVNIGVPED